MPKVVVRRASYDYDALREAFFEIMDLTGGNRIERNSRVLIKPNLLAPASPDRAMLTHPAVVRAAVEYVLEKGAVAQVSDSPAMGSFEKVLKESGIRSALEGLDVEFKEFKDSRIVDAGEPFHRLEIAREALDADLIINLPKLKTHSQMLLTLGVKNLFGCVVGFKKPEWHLRTGVDRDMFARLLVRIYGVLKPAFTILDGVLAMEGQGPGKGGVPREVGVLLGSDDSVALDMVVCRMLGIPSDRVLTNKASEEMGLLSGPIELDGVLPDVRGFKMPEIAPVVFGPQPFHGVLRKHLVQRPVTRDAMCRLCGDCMRYCPAQAISIERKAVNFDYDKCIRCYCCLEVCPHGALRAEEPSAGRIIRKLLGKSV
jgi:uncharacterized protein (DUF362 family)/Pyruvate/2-oxoacid:ferredoxin oxidoreductase delta subunit